MTDFLCATAPAEVQSDCYINTDATIVNAAM